MSAVTPIEQTNRSDSSPEDPMAQILALAAAALRTAVVRDAAPAPVAKEAAPAPTVSAETRAAPSLTRTLLTATPEATATVTEATQVVNFLKDGSGNPPAGITVDSVLARNLSVAQVHNLLNLNAPKVRTVYTNGGPLNQIADLSREGLNVVHALDKNFMQWLFGVGVSSGASATTLSDMAALSPSSALQLKQAFQAGYDGALSYPSAELVTPSKVSNPFMFKGQWTLTMQIGTGQKKGEKLVLTESEAPQLFAKAADTLRAGNQATIDKVRLANGMESEASVDILSLPSLHNIDDSKPSLGKLTIGQAASSSLLEQYQKGIADGSIGHDDVRAQYLRAVQAASALENGYSLLPYYESPKTFGTYRKFLGGEKDPTLLDMSTLDVQELLNADAVTARLEELFSNPTIQKDWGFHLRSETNLNKTVLRDELFADITGPGYTTIISTLKDQGLGYQAEQMIRRDLGNLTLLSPTLGAEAAQKLQINALVSDFQAVLDDPSLIEDPVFELAMRDSIALSILATRLVGAGTLLGTYSVQEVIKYLEEIKNDKVAVTNLSAVVKQLVIEAKSSGGTVNLGSVTQAQFDAAMSKTYVPLAERPSVSGMFGKLQGAGLWGSIAGGGAIAAFGYKISKGAWSADSTPIERFGAARDIIGFVSVLGEVTPGLASTWDGISKLMGKSANTDAAWKALGLDRTLPQVWGKTSFAPKNPLNYGAAVWNAYDDLSASVHSDDAFPRLTRAQQVQVASGVDNIQSIWDKALLRNDLAPATPAAYASVSRRIAISTLKVLGNVANTVAGISDIVIGAININKAAKKDDTAGVVAGSLQVVGGASFTVAGLLYAATLFGPVSALAVAATGPLFLAGFVLGFAAIATTLVVAQVKQHKSVQAFTESQNQFFRDLAKDGLADEEWANKLEYYHYAWSIYGNDNTNTANQSYIDFQRAEWEHFRKEGMSQGTSLGRLSEPDHVYTHLTTKDPSEPKDDGSGS